MARPERCERCGWSFADFDPGDGPYRTSDGRWVCACCAEDLPEFADEFEIEVDDFDDEDF